MYKPLKSAYLIIICDPSTNAINHVTIWSSPEWEQSRCLDDHTYVAYQVKSETYAQARDNLLQEIKQNDHRYNHLYQRYISELTD